MRTALCIIFALLPFAMSGQDPPPTFRTGVTYVHVDAAVTDGKRNIGGLEQTDFAILDQGQPQPIISFGRESAPLDIVLLLDVSGSMRSSIGELAEIANVALEELKATDRIGVIAFSRDTKVERELTTNKQAIAAAISAAASGGSIGLGTRINAAVIDAAKFLLDQKATIQPSMNARRAILIVTDNQPNGEHVPDQDVVKALYDADSVLFAIVVHPPARRYRHTRRAGDPFEVPDRIYFNYENVIYLAQVTGGEAATASNPRQSLAEMLANIRNRYSLVYHAPDADPGAFRRIRVQLTAPARARYPNAAVKARDGYYVNREQIR